MLSNLVLPPAGLLPFEGLLLPEGGEVHLLRTQDGIDIRSAFWRPETAMRGTMFVLQGRAEFIEKYGEVITRLLARGFAVAALDWRGQGGSQRQLANPLKGHVEDFEDYLFDLDALIAQADLLGCPKPYQLLAHSTGGAIALLALARGEPIFDRAILSSPLVEIAGLASQSAARFLARSLASIGLSSLFVPGGGKKTVADRAFVGNPFTSDPARFAMMQAWLKTEPKLGIGDPTIGWVDATFAALERMKDSDFGQHNCTPILMLLAGHDQVVNPHASERLAASLRGASAISLAGAEHELLMENDRIQSQFWSAFDAFMGVESA